MHYQQQANHVNEATAYYVHNYPYSFGKFCTIRYWVETRKVYGQRLMTQIQDPTTGQWFKAKTDGYFNVCIITSIVNPGFPNHGWVVPVQINLQQFDLPTLQQFGVYYTFTPFQKEMIMKAFATFSIHLAPVWDKSIELNYRLIELSENPVKLTAQQTVGPDGFPVESQHDAEKRVRREKRSLWPSVTGQPKQTVGGEDVTGMTDEQIDFMKDLLTPSEE